MEIISFAPSLVLVLVVVHAIGRVKISIKIGSFRR